MPTFRSPLLVLCLWLACVFVSRAQQTVPGEPPALPGFTPPNLPTAPGALPTISINGLINGAPPVEQPTTDLDFPNVPIADVLGFYEQLSGKHIIADNSVQGQMTLHVFHVTKTVATHMIETALNLNGFSVVASPDNVVEIIGLGKPPRTFGVPIYADVNQVPNDETVVTLFVSLENLDPQETSGLLGSYIPPSATIAFTPFAKAHALLITDTARSVKRLYGLVKQLDKPGPDIKEKFIKLERADATKAVEFLNSVFDTKGSTGTTPTGIGNGVGGAAIPGSTVRRPIRRVGEDGSVTTDVPGVATSAGGTVTISRDSLIVGKVTLTADVRTNRVHVVTTEANMEIVEALLADYDASTAFAAPVRFPLKFIRPDLLLPILVQSLQEGTEANGNGTTPGATNPGRNGQSNSNNSGLNSSSGLGGLNSGSGLGSSLGGLGSSGGGLGSLGLGSIGGSTQEIDTTPQEQIVGNNRLIADISNSAIIFLGGADSRDKVAAIIAQLDRRSPQVMIHTIIGELSLSNDHELGFQYLLRTKRLGLSNNANLLTTSTAATATTTATPATSTSASTSALNALSSLATGLGTNFSGVGGVLAVGNSLDIILAALDSTNRFKTISRPLIVTSNFKRAQITSGQTITVSTGSVGSLTTAATSTGIYNQTQQELAALTLTVTPQINSDKEVVMDVDQQLNSPLGTSSTINGAASQNLSVRSLHNYVSARNGETIVLGGLITQDDNVTDSNIPYLSRIPLLGNLFRTRTHDADRSELIILMQPEVVDTAAVMTNLRRREEDKTYLGPYLDRQIDPLERKKPIKKAIPVKKTTTTTTTVRTQQSTPVPTGK